MDDFITSLHSLSEYCNYGQLRDEMIRDRNVVGLRDSALSKKLQLESELAREKAITLVRNRESARKQQPLLRGDTTANIDAVSKQRRAKTQQTQKPKSYGNSTCSRCGKPSHCGKEQCPAKKAICRKCQKHEHFQSVCRSSQSVKTVTEDDENSDDSSDHDDEVDYDRFIGTIEESDTLQVPTVTARSDPWKVTVTLNSQPLEFHIDTGADVTMITEKLYKRPQLQKCTKSLVGPSKEALDVQGQFKGTLTHGNTSVEQEIHVVKGLHKPLIGRPAITALELASRIKAIDSGKQHMLDQHPELFQGLGTTEGEYNIVLKGDAKPYALATPRRIPL